MARLCLILSAGYFLSDMIICTKLKHYYPEATSYMVHHIVSIFGIVLSLRDQGTVASQTIEFINANFSIVSSLD